MVEIGLGFGFAPGALPQGSQLASNDRDHRRHRLDSQSLADLRLGIDVHSGEQVRTAGLVSQGGQILGQLVCIGPRRVQLQHDRVAGRARNQLFQPCGVHLSDVARSHRWRRALRRCDDAGQIHGSCGIETHTGILA